VTTDLSDAGRVPEDYLAEMDWVPFERLSDYDLIPNMMPVIESFLQLVDGQSGIA
jgi:hypothetical protein